MRRLLFNDQNKKRGGPIKTCARSEVSRQFLQGGTEEKEEGLGRRLALAVTTQCKHLRARAKDKVSKYMKWN